MTQTHRGRNPPPLVVCAKRRRKDGARAMTPKEKLKVHVQIERENARKLREWQEQPKTWKEQVETKLMNLELANEAMREMIEMGVVS